MKKTIIACTVSGIVALAIGAGVGVGVFKYMDHSAKTTVAAPAEEIADTKDDVFVSLPETIVTLHDEEGNDRYMLLEVAMVAENKDETQQIKAEEPLYQSVVVDTFSDMQYEDVRKLKSTQIGQTLIAALGETLKSRHMKQAFKDILVQKVVYQ